MRPLAVVAAVLAASGCSIGNDEAVPTGPPQLASGRLIPKRCVPQTPPRTATVAFVANGSAWAVNPANGRLFCLFAAQHAGPFAWGPRADRALLARLEVKSFDTAPSRPPSRVRPRAPSWGRPIGKSIVFVGNGGRTLLKAHPAGGGFIDVTPLRGFRYERVVYHPSGLAFAFVAQRNGRESVWISTNIGKEPRQLVHGRFHTGFDALAFSRDGRTLYFGAQHGDTHVDLHSIPVAGDTKAPLVWRGGPHERVTEIQPGGAGDLVFTAGRSCESERAILDTVANPGGREALPGHGRSRAVGWIDDSHVLVESGKCGQPVDLYSVSALTLESRLITKRVGAASVLRAEPFPPPPLPEAGSGSGFA
jgi:hypothetical protein